MNIRTERDGEVSILRLEGKVSHEVVPEFRAKIDGLLQQGANRMVFDLSRVPLLDSSALGTLILTHMTLQRDGGKAVLVGPQKPVQDILRITRLDTVFEIYPTTDGALKTL